MRMCHWRDTRPILLSLWILGLCRNFEGQVPTRIELANTTCVGRLRGRPHWSFDERWWRRSDYRPRWRCFYNSNMWWCIYQTWQHMDTYSLGSTMNTWQRMHLMGITILELKTRNHRTVNMSLVWTRPKRVLLKWELVVNRIFLLLLLLTAEATFQMMATAMWPRYWIINGKSGSGFVKGENGLLFVRLKSQGRSCNLSNCRNWLKMPYIW